MKEVINLKKRPDKQMVSTIRVNSGDNSHPDENKSKEALIKELGELRTRVERNDGSESKLYHVENRPEKPGKKYRFIYSPTINMVVDIDGIIKKISKLSAAQLGYREDEIIGKNVIEFVVPEEKERVRDQLFRDYRGDYTPSIEVSFYGKDESVHSILFSPGPAVLYEDDHTSRILFTGIDITERKRAEEELEKTKSSFHNIVERSADGIVVLDRDGRMLYVNKSFKSMFRHKGDKSEGEHFEYPIVVDELSELEFKGLNGDDRIGEMQIIDTKWLGKSAYLVSIRDITDRKEMEEELKKYTKDLEEEVRLQADKLIQSEKMASLGQLVAGVAHEVNNPLAYVKLNTQFIDRILFEFDELCKKNDIGLDKLQQVRELIKININGIVRIEKITTTLKRFAKPDTGGKDLVNINEGMMDTLIMVNNKIKYKAEIHENYGDIPKIPCNIGQLNQVFMNLILNASQSMETGDIWIRTWNDRNNVFIEIKDNGEGISKDKIGKIFDPFFTTKEKGMGFGLSISYRIIEDHDGDITVSSDIGKGTSMLIRLPMGS